MLQYASVAELDMIINMLEQKPENNNVVENTVFKPAETPSNDKFSIKIVD